MLFIPFRDESSLLLENKSAEEAFNRLINENSSAYHAKSQRILDAQSKISGVGGTGKSFLIEAIKLLVGKIWPSKEVTVAVAAPTGLATFNVGGLTVHRLFQLPIEHEGKSAEYWPLPKASQKVMKTKLHSVKLIIVDEISMGSSLTPTYIHLRLEELFGGDDWFGSRNMFVGDLLQLQPVSGNPVFQNITQKALLHKLGCTASVNIWRDLVVYDELTINKRQKSDVALILPRC